MTVATAEKPVKEKKTIQKGGAGKTVKPAGSKKKVKKDDVLVQREIVYPHIDVNVFTPEHLGYMSGDVAKQLLGWKEEAEGEDFGKEYLLMVGEKKVRCYNNLTNRPYYPALANDWMLEILRGSWEANGETIIIDRTGMVQDGQHRMLGLILAIHEWLANKDRWSVWKVEPTMPALVVTGINESDRTVNTIGVGKPRSPADVIYRSQLFAKLSDRERFIAARMLAHAVRLMRHRTMADQNAFAPKRSHSELLDFIYRHLRVLECVKHVQLCDSGTGRKVARYIPTGYAAGLLYLMGAATTEQDDYVATNSEEAINWKLWEKACDFWELLAGGDKSLSPVSKSLLEVDSTGASGALALAEKSAIVIKAWNLFSDGEPITSKKIHVSLTEGPTGQQILAEYPRCGGIDLGESILEDEDEE